MDIFDSGWLWWQEQANLLPVSIYSFLFRSNLILGVPALLVFIGFMKAGWRSKQLNILLLITGFIFGMSVPLKVDYYSPLRPWLILAFIINLAVIPNLWAFLWEPRKAFQHKIRRRFQIALATLFIINLWWCR